MNMRVKGGKKDELKPLPKGGPLRCLEGLGRKEEKMSRAIIPCPEKKSLLKKEARKHHVNVPENQKSA